MNDGAADPGHDAGEAQPYRGLLPAVILEAGVAAGIEPDGRLLALNSYENRVYQLGVEGAAPVVLKFYRPERWSDAAILEEHEWTRELAARDIPVVAPLPGPDGGTLHLHAGFRYAVYPRRGGRAPELEDPEALVRIGRLLGRVHALGALHPFLARPAFRTHLDVREARRFLLDSGLVSGGQRDRYALVALRLIEALEALEAEVGPLRGIRLHGDCHPGNVLVDARDAALVDFDDAVQGPAVQDLWMFVTGEADEAARRRESLLDGYLEFHDFAAAEWAAVEALRARRMLHHAAWLGRRWGDPAFPRAFPFFATEGWWSEHVAALLEQAERIERLLEESCA